MIESYCYDKNFCANFLDWKKEYVEYLKTAYWNGEDKYKGLKIYYQDPDSKESYSRVYYKKLAEFLNQRERALSNEINGEEFFYKADNYPGRGVLIRVESKDGKELFYLQSDQFGFSAPKGSAVKETQMRIYDVYLKGSKDEYKEEKVATWIWSSRTIGGSFLWPLEKGENRNPDYNKKRGGMKTLQDRCDLTLAEIRGCYEKDMREIGGEGNYLYNKMKNKKNENLRRWLKHFGDFETYVKYFCMEDFVDTDKENNKKFYPINLYCFPKQDETINENYKKEDIYNKTENEEKYYENLRRMLTDLCNMIVERSKKMENILNGVIQ